MFFLKVYLPEIKRQKKIHVICEGDEDFAYFNKLMSLNVWNSIYNFSSVNVKSASNISARFQADFQNDHYELILIFCDTDKAPYKEYKQVKDKINSFLGKADVAEKIIIFANPCTMQIILSHFGDVSLKTQGKGANSKEIEQLTGVQNYDAHADQIKDIMKQIFQRTYSNMADRVKKINFSDTTAPSTNFGVFLERFESDATGWITEIQQYLNG